MSEKFDIRRASGHRTKLFFIIPRPGHQELRLLIAPKHRDYRLKTFNFFQSPNKEEVWRLSSHSFLDLLILRPPRREVRQFDDRSLQAHLTMLFHGKSAGSDERIDMFNSFLDHP